MNPFTQTIELPEPLVDLDDVATVGQVLELAEELGERLTMDRTDGVGCHRGKKYVRFQINGVVRKDGRLYEHARSGKPSLEGSGAIVTWQTWNPHPQQKAYDLYVEYKRLSGRCPELVERADVLYGMLEPRLREQGDLGFQRAGRVWLTIMAALVSAKTGATFEAYLVSGTVNQAMAETFDVTSWKDLARVELDEGAVTAREWLSLDTETGQWKNVFQAYPQLRGARYYDGSTVEIRVVGTCPLFPATRVVERAIGGFNRSVPAAQLVQILGYNTEISYKYRDGANNKRHNRVVLQGFVSDAQVRALLGEESYFIPRDVGLPDLFPTDCTFDEDIDGPWHTFDGAVATQLRPTADMTAAEFLALVEKASREGWPGQHEDCSW